MSKEIFSIIIPTRERHDTLKYSIQSVLNQTYKDFELVIMDNFSSHKTLEVVEHFGDPRIKYYRSPKRLSMTDNWELGLSHAKGEYVFVLGDDDAVMPDGIDLFIKLISEYDINIVSWFRPQYWWPNATVPWLRNTLDINLSQDIEVFNSREMLKLFYQSKVLFEHLPMIYNSWVRRDVIAKVKSIHGKYFMSHIPDVHSGIVNAYFTDSYVYSMRPFSIAGLSGHSTGTSTGYTSLNVSPLEAFMNDAGKNVTKDLHPDLVSTCNQEIMVADALLRAKEKFFLFDNEISLNINNLIQMVAGRINRDVGNYENTMKDIVELASKHGIPLSTISIPSKSFSNPKPFHGPIINQEGNIVKLVINCEPIEILDVYQASKLAYSILPKIENIGDTFRKLSDKLPPQSQSENLRWKALQSISNDYRDTQLKKPKKECATTLVDSPNNLVGIIGSKDAIKIIIDGIFFQFSQTSGIARVWISILKEWVKTGFSKHILVLDRAGTAPKIEGIKYRTIHAYNYENTDLDRRLLQQICDEEKADLFISTYYTTPVLTPSVFMAYDMVPEMTGADLSSPMWKEKHRGISCAFSYLAISNSTVDDLVKCFSSVSSEEVTVAHCGIEGYFNPANSEEKSQFKAKYGILKPYFLLVGERFGCNGYKNAILFFKAFHKLNNKHEFEIVCVGGANSLEPELMPYTHGINVHLLKLTDDELRCAYSSAISLVYPSKYEGFGLPILEAMACGCPVITCRNSSIPEVSENAALYTDENDAEKLLNLLNIIQLPEIRNHLIPLGLEQAKKFSWQKMADTISSALLSTIEKIEKQSLIKQQSLPSSDSIEQQWILSSEKELEHLYSGEIGQKHQELLAKGLRNKLLTDEKKQSISKLNQYIAKGWKQDKTAQHFLAASLYCYPHQLPEKWFENAEVPEFLVDYFVNFMFETPSFFKEINEISQYYQYVKNWVDFIHLGVTTEQDSPLWQQLAWFFTQRANFISLYCSTENLKEIYVKRAEIMEIALKQKGFQLDYSFPPRDKSRRKIRLGILSMHFVPQTETFATLPVFEHLDRSFEIILYTSKITNHPLEQYCESRADRLVQLPEDVQSQVEMLRQDNLDILWMVNNVTAVTHNLTLLALHRLACLQVTSFCSPTTTGMRHVDYFIAGELSSDGHQEQFSEQLVNLKGSGICFNYATEYEPPTIEATKAKFGIPEDKVVLISGANFYKIIPELRETWAKILAAVPNAVLVLYPFGPAWSSSYPKEPFINMLHMALEKHGASKEQLIILEQLPTRGDVKELLKLADIYLDSYPYSGATSLLDPLSIGLPMILMNGNALRFRQGVAMLNSIGLDDFITQDEESYINLAVKLGTDAELRKQYREQILEKMANNPPFLDSKAYSVQIGDILKQLFEKHLQ